MSELQDDNAPVRTVDLTGEVCPMTTMKARVHLAQITVGQVLEFIVKEGEQMRDVPLSIKQDGHRIEKVRREGERFHVFVRKGA